MPPRKKTAPASFSPDVLIVGAGLGGLALACRLAYAGKKVSVYEKNTFAGGRLTQIKEKGYTIDLGPTFLLMPGEFEELFASCGRKFSDYVKIAPLEPNYRLHFADRSTLDVSSNLPAVLKEIERVSPSDKEGFLSFLAREQYVYDTIYPTFIAKSPESLADIIFSGNLGKFLDVDAFVSMWLHMDSFFSSDKLKLAFSFQSMYIGHAPTHAPATYSIIPYVELAQGVWYPEGGMNALADGIVRLAKELGVDIHLHAPVQEILIENKLAVGVRLANGSEVRAGTTVCNLDLPAAYRKLIPSEKRTRYSDAKIDRLDYGCSAFMLYLGVDRDYSSLLHHNVFFSEDFLQNFEEIFQEQKLSEDPSIYVNMPTRTNPSLAPQGKHLLYILVPVPNQKKNPIDWESKKEEFAEKIIQVLEKRGLADLSKHIRMKKVFTPLDWQALGGMHFASTFGLSPTFMQSSVFRPKQKSEEFQNLYFVGASTHPGSGMPMVLISARTCADKIITSISMSRPSR